MWSTSDFVDIPSRIKRNQWLLAHAEQIFTCEHCAWQGTITENMWNDIAKGGIPSCPNLECAEAFYIYPRNLMHGWCERCDAIMGWPHKHIR